jgi:carboxymethylenebutenolidase
MSTLRRKQLSAVCAALLGTLAFVVPAHAATSAGSTRAGAATVVTTAIGTTADAYVVGPETSTAGIVLLHDRFGLDAPTLDLADRLAKMGYRVVAIDLFDGRSNADPARAARLVRAIDPAWSETNLRAALAYLRAPQRKLAVVGYGYGGAAALRAPLVLPGEVTAVVDFYGPVPSDQRVVQRLDTAVLAIFSRGDLRTPEADIASFEKDMRIYNHPVSITRVSAGYGFAHPGYSTYDAATEQSTWREVVEFLAQLVPAGSIAPPPPAQDSPPPMPDAPTGNGVDPLAPQEEPAVPADVSPVNPI